MALNRKERGKKELIRRNLRRSVVLREKLALGLNYIINVSSKIRNNLRRP